VYNYNISQNIGCAALLKAYKNFKGGAFTGDFYAMIQDELLSKVDSSLFWYFQSPTDLKFDRMNTIWNAYGDTSNGVAPGNAYRPITENYDLQMSTIYTDTSMGYNPTYNNIVNYANNNELFLHLEQCPFSLVLNHYGYQHN
jgi:hypothetical protein